MTNLDDEIDRACMILAEAITEHRPIAIFAAYSGGNDSMVSTHFTMKVLEDQATVLHLDTGIGIPATREHVHKTATDFGWPMRVEKTAQSYEDLVLGKVKGYMGGFPGPAMHNVMYARLKERPIRAAIAAAKEGHPRSSRVLIVSGIRADESDARTGYNRATSKVDSQVWVNPFYWATYEHFIEYRKRFDLPRNPVKDRVGISGECLCGDYAHENELLHVEMTCPATGAYLRDLEKRVRAAGFPWGWEEGPPDWWIEERKGQGFLFEMDPEDDGPDFRPACHGCEKIRMLMQAAS